MSDFTVVGAGDLARLAGRLKAEGHGALRLELMRGIRNAAKRAIPDVTNSALHTLPRTGGLNTRVASQVISVRSSYAGSGARVRLQGQGMKELRDIDAGRVRHPVWGNRKRWAAQNVTPGFFTNPIVKRAPDIRMEIELIMRAVAYKVTRGV